MNSNRDWKKNWLNKGEYNIPEDKTPYMLCNTLWMNIRGCIVDIILIVLANIILNNGNIYLWLIVIFLTIVFIYDLTNIGYRRMLLINIDGIHLLEWNHFHKKETLVEVIYKWDVIKKVYFVQQASNLPTLPKLILITKSGKKEISFNHLYLPFFYKKKLKEKIIGISNRIDIFDKNKLKWL